jgi:hypothetical protein
MTPESIAWPPREEDLDTMYVGLNMSAAKIAEAYGLKYASPKTAESTVHYHLKRNGIARRDRAFLVRKVANVRLGSLMEPPGSRANFELAREWSELARQIRAARDAFVAEARTALTAKRR